MRGRPNPQCSLLAIVDLEERVPKGHSLRRIEAVADAALERLSPEFNRMYAQVGRALVPPERLLDASLLIALYSVRSERAFCEELEYNLLYRWFLDMDLMERSCDATVFIKNRPRLLAHDAGRALFDEVVWAADAEGLLRKGRGKEARLAFLGHGPDGNRNGLLMDFTASRGMRCRSSWTRVWERGHRPRTLGADRPASPMLAVRCPPPAHAGGRPWLRHQGLCAGHACAEGNPACGTEEVVPALHEVPQQFAHLWVQAHAALHHRLPECQQDGAGLRRSCPGQASQDGQQDLVQVGQVVLVETPVVPPHGALLPVQTRRLQGRSVDRVVVGRQQIGRAHV